MGEAIPILLLIFFNPIIGPDILSTVPSDLLDLLSEEDTHLIKRLMDTATPGFFTHAFSPELNTANYFFMIPSAWARGKQEMVMITKIIEEEAPSLYLYEREFREFVKQLKETRPNLYKALYINNPPLNYEAEIKAEFDYLKQQFEVLSKFFAISQAQTHGILIPFRDIRKNQGFYMPIKIVRDLETFLDKRENYFFVFQRRKENFKVDVIPYNEKRVVKFAVIFNGQLSPDTLKEIGLILQELKLPFVYTSGICQQGGKCVYEVYLNPESVTDFEPTKERLLRIRDVEEVKIVEIELTPNVSMGTS